MFGLSLGLGLGNQAASAGGGGGATFAWSTADSNAGLTFSNSNQTTQNSSTTNRTARVANTHSKTPGSAATGQFVVTVTVCGNTDIGIVDTSLAVAADGYSIFGQGKAIAYANSGTVTGFYTGSSAGYASYTDGDVITCAYVLTSTAFLVGFAKNGTWQGGFNPSTGANGLDISVTANGGTNGVASGVPAITTGSGGGDMTNTTNFSGW